MSFAPVAGLSAVAGAVSGVVTNSTGQPVAGARVVLRGPTTASATTDAKGVFRAENLPSGTYEASFIKGGYQTTSIDGIAVSPGTEQHLTVTLSAATLQTINAKSPALTPLIFDITVLLLLKRNSGCSFTSI